MGTLPVPAARQAFEADLAALVRTEQARERRRLCTDPALYRKACERTAGEIRRYNAVGEDARNRMDGLLARARCVLIWSSRIVKTRMSQR